ncbi:membrane integrity-associated transporter subunit PqiC [bacterium]|nr:membrane integrity-associated transporter subunit PqiC [bacterium]
MPLVLCGCGIPARPRIAVRHYALGAPAIEAPTAAPAVNALAIAPFDSPSHYTDRIFYRDKNNAAGHYAQDRWVAAPADMITRLVAQSLRQARVAQAVARERLLRDADLVLAGDLVRFEIVRDGRNCTAACELQLVIRDLRKHTVVFARSFAAEVPVKKPLVPVARVSVAAMVAALDAATSDVLTRATTAIGKALAEMPK